MGGVTAVPTFSHELRELTRRKRPYPTQPYQQRPFSLSTTNYANEHEGHGRSQLEWPHPFLPRMTRIDTKDTAVPPQFFLPFNTVAPAKKWRGQRPGHSHREDLPGASGRVIGVGRQMITAAGRRCGRTGVGWRAVLRVIQQRLYGCHLRWSGRR